MVLFPFFEDIEKKNILIVGGGKVAEEKFFRLYPFTDHITIVAKEIIFSVPKNIEVLEKEFEEKDLAHIHICIAATNDRGTNYIIAQLCHQKGIKVNVVDDGELCDFIFPSLVKKGDLVIGISTGGKAPAVASYLREQLEANFPECTDEIMESLGNIRPFLVEKISNHKVRGTVMKQLFLSMIEENRAYTKEECRNLADNILEEFDEKNQTGNQRK